MKRIIDLTLPITSNMPCQDSFPGNIYVSLVSHEESLKFGAGSKEDPHTSTWSYIGMVEHIGTHVDAFYHMNPKGLSVDEMPLDMFFGKAVCFDMRHIPERGKITAEDLERAQNKEKVKVDGHIVLFATGLHDKYYPDKKVLSVNPEITPDAIKWLAAHGSKLHGVEGPSTDIMDLNQFPSHRACRDVGITHYEWLINLTELIGVGEFTFYGIPLRLTKGSGSPVRAFAVIGEED